MSKWYEDYFGAGAVSLGVGTVIQDGQGRIFLTGVPNDSHLPADERHNCDAMGCASGGPHILAYLGKKVKA